MIVDVLIAGSGSAGLTTAVVAAKAGLSVQLVEKTNYYGGTTALSGGGVWIPNNNLMRNHGWRDSADDALGYIHQVVGNHMRSDMISAFLRAGPEMLDFMQANTRVSLIPRPSPDYYPDLPGGTLGGRSLAPLPFDGRELGDLLSALRPPLRQYNAPWGMMMGVPDVIEALNVFRSRSSAVHMGKLLARFGRDRVVYGRGTRLLMGSALTARFLKSASDAGVSLWKDSPIVSLLLGPNGVTGAVVRRNGEEIPITARCGVVLATGGFAANEEMRQRYYPMPDQTMSLVPGGNMGDGIALAETAGGHVVDDNAINGSWAVVSHYHRSDGSIIVVPHFFMDLPKPGAIAVNRQGNRFGNESSLRLVEKMHETGSVPAWIICDANFIQRYGLGFALPFGLRVRKLLKQNYLTRASSLTALAAKIGVEADALQRTVADANRAARNGKDDPFGKGATAFDRSLGDEKHNPNPCLGVIEQGPFYAVQIFPGDVSTNVGLRVSTKGEVLTRDGIPITGLYAVGLDMNSIWSGVLPANGGYHGVNMTFGYIVAKQLISRSRA